MLPHRLPLLVSLLVGCARPPPRRAASRACRGARAGGAVRARLPRVLRLSR
jgi:hypothetical protein